MPRRALCLMTPRARVALAAREYDGRASHDGNALNSIHHNFARRCEFIGCRFQTERLHEIFCGSDFSLTFKGDRRREAFTTMSD